MKFKMTPRPKLGDAREIIDIALFPTQVGDETYWFEQYTAVQRYDEGGWRTIKKLPLQKNNK